MTRILIVAALAALAMAPNCQGVTPDPNPPQPPAPVPTVVADAGHVTPPAPSPTPPTPPPPAPADAYSAACDHLASIGCSEGSASSCADRMRVADQQHLTTVPAACLTKATTKAAARACGFVKCQ